MDIPPISKSKYFQFTDTGHCRPDCGCAVPVCEWLHNTANNSDLAFDEWWLSLHYSEDDPPMRDGHAQLDDPPLFGNW